MSQRSRSERYREILKNWRDSPETSAVLTDIDGTLAPIAPTPDEASVSPGLKAVLKEIEEKYLLLAGISGRKTQEARDLVGLDSMTYFGNHGFEMYKDGEIEVIPEALPYFDKVKELEELAREKFSPEGVYVEDKGITSSIHFRNVPREVGERCVAFVRKEGERLGLHVGVGRGVVESRPPIEANKGTAVRRLVEQYRPERAMFLGDDTTDLDAFKELERLKEEGVLVEIVRVGVRSDEGPEGIISGADVAADGVEGVEEFLRALL